ncbi:hypothetical protein BH24DEI2_BH24DEI2_05700 [soil metagenome]
MVTLAEPRFITDEAGERVGVLLDLATYERLVRERAHDQDLSGEMPSEEQLSGLSTEELHALADVKLALDTQERLHELLTKQAEAGLENDEIALLDVLLEQVDGLNILKARAKYTLKMTSAQAKHDTPE